MQLFSAPCAVRVNLAISGENIGKVFWKGICFKFTNSGSHCWQRSWRVLILYDEDQIIYAIFVFIWDF